MEDSKKKWVLFAAFAIGVVALLVVVFVVVFAPAKTVAKEESVRVEIPDGEASRMEESKSKVYRGSTEAYYAMLDAVDPAAEDIPLTSESGETKPVAAEPVASTRPEAAAERVFGAPSSDGDARSGSGMTGGRHSQPVRESRQMTPEERLEYDRKRAEIVKEVLTGAASEEMPDQVGHDVEPEILRFAQNDNDGIITTLDDEPSAGVGYGIRPFRCMFVRDEKLKNGQRVTLRLLEDYAEGGVRIPANTHLSAICKISERLELQVRSLDLGGRIVSLSLDAYDTDGMQGIYCPETASAKNTKEVSRDALTAGTTAFGGLVGDLANTVLRTGASIARNTSGEVSVSVVSGYEFYLVKVEKR